MDAMFEGESPRARLALLLHHFSKLEDNREPWRIVYPLREVLLLVTCATIASCDDFEDIITWATRRRCSRSFYSKSLRMGLILILPTSTCTERRRRRSQ